MRFAPPTTAPIEGLPAPQVRTSDLIAGERRRAASSITIENVVEGAFADQLWELYKAAIGPLDQIAALRHLDSEADMLATFAEPAITKIIAWDGDEPVGLGLITNQLELVPEISPDFFNERYAEQAARDAVYYGMAVLVKASSRGLTVFPRVYLEMWQIPASVGGVLIFDMCRFNRDFFEGDTLVENIAANFPNSSWKVIDQQTWYAAELPQPLP